MNEGSLRQEYLDYIKEAREKNVEYLIIVCDTFDHDTYPVFCQTKEEFITDYKRFRNANMQRIEHCFHVYENMHKPVDLVQMHKEFSNV